MALQQPPTHSEDASGVTEVRRRKTLPPDSLPDYAIIAMRRPAQAAAEYGSGMLAATKRRIHPFFLFFSFFFFLLTAPSVEITTGPGGKRRDRVVRGGI